MEEIRLLSAEELRQRLESSSEFVATRSRKREDMLGEAQRKEHDANVLDGLARTLRQEASHLRNTYPRIGRDDITATKESLKIMRVLLQKAREAGRREQVYELRGEQKRLRKQHCDFEKIWQPKYGPTRPHQPISNRRQKKVSWHNQHALFADGIYL